MADNSLSLTGQSVLNRYYTVMARTPSEEAFMNRHTLNFKYSIYPENKPTIVPQLLYFGVGINGRYNVDSDTLMAPYDVRSLELDLNEPIPFRCRPLDEDLTEQERTMYRMRVVKDIHGIQHACYYLKKMVYLDTVPQFYRVDEDNNTLVPYELENRWLNPEPQKPSPSNLPPSSDPTVVVAMRASLTVTASEILEYINAYYGNPRKAVISEWGIYSGQDQLVDGVAAGSGTVRYTESICTSLEYKTTTLGTAMESSDSSVSRSLLLGEGACFLP